MRDSGPKLAAMQPYFLPHRGYFQLAKEVDYFVILDELPNSKRKWINGNLFMVDNKAVRLSLPLSKRSTSTPVSKLTIHPDHNPKKISSKLSASYSKSPMWSRLSVLAEVAAGEPGGSLAELNTKLISKIFELEEIRTEIILQSSLAEKVNYSNRNEMLSGYCDYFGARTYLNNETGLHLYSSEFFSSRGISLRGFPVTNKGSESLSFFHDLAMGESVK